VYGLHRGDDAERSRPPNILWMDDLDVLDAVAQGSGLWQSPNPGFTFVAA
jgi:hypothetical protein